MAFASSHSVVLPILLITAIAWRADAAAARNPRDDGVFDALEVIAIQQEPEDREASRYDWGPSVMRDGGLYRMWWVRLGGGKQQRFPYAGTLPDGERFDFSYPDWGDRIYYAESRDGKSWHLAGGDYTGDADVFGPDAAGPLMVLSPAESRNERNHVGTPSVIKVDGRYYMYYESACEYVLTRGPDGQPRVGNEYHNQILLAESADGRRWRKYPDDADPQPIVPAPEANKLPGRQRYGLGQPSVCYRDGRFIMHYVDSCTAPGDWIVRLEADNPHFRNARTFARRLQPPTADAPVPGGAVARFAQTDVNYLGEGFCLVRPAYGTGDLNLLATRTGLFDADAGARMPREVFPQVRTPDPRGEQYRERLYPGFLTTPAGAILLENNAITVYYSSGLGFKEHAYTWDLRCARIPADGWPGLRALANRRK